MTQALAVSLKALGASTTSGTGSSVDLLSDSEGAGAPRKVLKLDLDLRSVTGGAQIVIEIETSPDNATWTVAKSSGPHDVAGLHEVVAGGTSRYARAKWTITGDAPSITWSLVGQAHVVYCEPGDLISKALPPESITDIAIDVRWDACITATDEAAGYVGNAYGMPLKAWGLDLRGKTAKIAAAELFRFRGCDPNGHDKIVFDTESAARKWFDRLADGKLSPPGIVDSTDEEFEGGSVVVSGTPRGW